MSDLPKEVIVKISSGDFEWIANNCIRVWYAKEYEANGQLGLELGSNEYMIQKVGEDV
jgi:hypothetical protein